MPILTVQSEPGAQTFEFIVGQSLRQILNNLQLPVRSGCLGLGACGLCLVQILKGETGTPSANEYFFVDADQMAQGVRLACQVKPTQDMTIAILAPAPKSAWKRLAHPNEQRIGPPATTNFENLPAGVNRPYGAAVDLGTTNLSVSLYDLTSGAWLAGRVGQNPQMVYGPDVITRLVNAVESEELALAMRQAAFDAISAALWDIAIPEGIDLQHIVRLNLVGNTAMLALLSGRNFDLLLQPRHWTYPVDCLPEDANSWARAWGIHPQAHVEVLPPVAGFVGSDLLAGVFATRLTELGSPSLLIDFGTNSEIALWDGSTLWSTSAAGGPAFEGSGISCGMPAVDGAICKVNTRSGALAYFVIGGGPPTGICGSGLVDLIACLVRDGTLSVKGKFAPGIPDEGFSLRKDGQVFKITRADVDVFQRAKAAIGVGTQALLDAAGLQQCDLRRVCVSGAFGHSLNIQNAQEIGLLPGIEPEWVELCGNTALAGCAEALLSAPTARQMTMLGKKTRLINLSQLPDFDTFFLENLFLQPIEEHMQC